SMSNAQFMRRLTPYSSPWLGARGEHLPSDGEGAAVLGTILLFSWPHKLSSILRVGLLLVWILASALSLRAEILSVGQTGSLFSNVSSAVAAAKPGDTVRVQAGTYRGNLLLDKPVQLEGSARPVLHGSGHGSVVTVLAPGCLIKGFVIEASG